MSVIVENALHPLTLNPVFFHVGRHYNEVGTKSQRMGHRHGGMQAKFAGNVVARGNDPAFAGTATDGDGHISQARVVAHLHRGIEAVTVAVNDFAHSG